jgi:hypothetical protein
MTYQTTSSSSLGATDAGPVTVVTGIALLINIVGLYAFTGVALCVFGYIGLTLMLSSWAARTTKNPGSADAGNTVMLLSWGVALVGGALVGAFHWVEYAHAAYVVLGTYALAALIWLIGRAFTLFWSWLFPLAGLAMLTAVMQLGSPPGADDMEKKESWTPVNVLVVDRAGKPIDGATVLLDLVQIWQGDPAWDGDRPWWCKGTTDNEGKARMELHEDPRFKRLVIRVRREPFASGYNPPTTIGGYVGYDDARLQTTLPAPKVPYAFQIEMHQRAHPDSALLAVELEAPRSSAEVVSRSIKVALTTEPDLPWYRDRRTVNEAAVANHGEIRDVYLNGSQRLVFKLGADLGGRPLTLHVLERDWGSNDEGVLELRRVPIDAIPLGAERTLPTLPLPGRRSTGRETPDTLSR